MVNYVIGDVQGCYDPLMRLLEKIDFDETTYRLWFVGDLVNRGPQSLEVLQFVKSLPLTPYITLGNHDLHLLAKMFGGHTWTNNDDTLETILKSEEREELGDWLRKQRLLYHDEALNVVMVHAGIPSIWDLETAKARAKELETVLSSDDFPFFLQEVYGNEPSYWDDSLTGIERLRSITNYLTRMRFLDASGRLYLSCKGEPDKAPPGFYPWFKVPGRKKVDAHIVFGHWAALGGQYISPTIHALDTGCLWGGELTALRLEDWQRFSVSGMTSSS